MFTGGPRWVGLCSRRWRAAGGTREKEKWLLSFWLCPWLQAPERRAPSGESGPCSLPTTCWSSQLVGRSGCCSPPYDAQPSPRNKGLSGPSVSSPGLKSPALDWGLEGMGRKEGPSPLTQPGDCPPRLLGAAPFLPCTEPCPGGLLGIVFWPISHVDGLTQQMLTAQGRWASPSPECRGRLSHCLICVARPWGQTCVLGPEPLGSFAWQDEDGSRYSEKR